MRRLGRVLASCLWVAGCGDDAKSEDSKPAEGTSESKSDDAETKVAATAPDRRLTVSPDDRGPLIGHFRLGAIDSIVGKVRKQMTPPGLSLFVSTSALKSALTKEADKPIQKATLEHFAFDKPVFCGLADPMKYAEPAACALGYSGGAEQLAEDLALEMTTAKAEGHVAHLVSDEGKHVYLDDQDGFVFVSPEPELFGEVGKTVVALAKSPGRDLEFALYPSVLTKTYAPLLRKTLSDVAEGRGSGKEIRREVEGRLREMGVVDLSDLENLLDDLDDLSPEDAKEALDAVDVLIPLLDEVDTAGLGVDLEPAGLVLSAWYDATTGSKLQAERHRGPKVDPDWASTLPAESLFAGASVDVEDEDEDIDQVDETWSEIISELIAELYEEYTGNPRAFIEPELAEFRRARDELYGPRTAWSIYTGDGGGAVVLIRELDAGKSGRKAWKDWATRFGAERILGKDASRYVTWSLTPDAASVGGVPIDRWSITITEETGRELESDLFLASVGQYLIDHGGFSLHVDRFEKDGRASFVFAPVKSEAFVEAAIEAQASKKVLAGVDEILGRGTHPLSFWGFDLAKISVVAKDAAKEEVPEMLRKATIGTDLADLYGVTYLRTDGGAAELVVSQGLIDQLVAAAKP